MLEADLRETEVASNPIPPAIQKSCTLLQAYLGEDTTLTETGPTLGVRPWKLGPMVKMRGL